MRAIRTRKPKVMKLDGTEYTVFRVGDLAEQVGRSAVTVSYWRRNGVLPPSPFQVLRGAGFDHFFTADMIRVVEKAVEANSGGRGGGITDSAAFYDEVRAGWEALGFEVEPRE